MNSRFMKIVFAGFVTGSMLASTAMAQEATDPGHPRVNQVDQRLDNQENRTNNGLKDGQMGTGQAARDEHRDARVEKQMGRDEAKHNGHLTRREQKHMNRELNHNSRKIHNQRHDHPAHPGAQ